MHRWNKQYTNATDIDIVMSIYKLIENSNNYSKASGSLWKYYRDELALNANGVIIEFPADHTNSASFKLKTKIASQIDNEDTKDVKIMVPLKQVNRFWEALEIS